MVGTLLQLNGDNGWTLKHRNQIILVVFKYRNSSLDYYDTVRKFKREDDGAVLHDQVIDECKNKQYHNTEYWSVEMKKGLRQCTRIGQLTNGYQFWQKEDERKTFQYCLNPNCLHNFLFLRAIQGHSGSTINLALQDNVLLPEGFT